MTISPKRIERLWSAYPELRPEMQHETACDGLSSFYSMGGEYYYDYKIAHALIRDKIADVLSKLGTDIIRYGGGWAAYRNGIKLVEECERTECHLRAAENNFGLPEWKE